MIGEDASYCGSRNADSAGQPWQGRSFASSYAYVAYEDDSGQAPLKYTGALQDLSRGEGTEADVIHALSRGRLLVPVVAYEEQNPGEVDAAAALDSSKKCRSGAGASVGTVTLTAPDGRAAMPVFTSTDSLAQWHHRARPVPIGVSRAAAAAVQQGAELLVVDPGGLSTAVGSTVTFVVRRPALWALAEQRQWLPAYDDPAVSARIQEVVRQAAQMCPLNSLVSSSSADILTPRTVATLLHRVSVARGDGVGAPGPRGLHIDGGGLGPEIAVRVGLDEGMDGPTLRQLRAGIEAALVADSLVAERVDSLSVSIHSSTRSL